LRYASLYLRKLRNGNLWRNILSQASNQPLREFRANISGQSHRITKDFF
jgi:hypothetical protein